MEHGSLIVETVNSPEGKAENGYPLFYDSMQNNGNIKISQANPMGQFIYPVMIEESRFTWRKKENIKLTKISS